MEASFKINGKCCKATPATVPINTTLNSFIRNFANLTGTKFMCLEGFCGVCTVTVKYLDPVTNEDKIIAVNSCMQNVYSCHNTEITTVEGVGTTKTGLHPIQKQLIKNHGIQCGYCSPGMVMNMYSLYESKGHKVSGSEIENSFGGNYCRCTGYRPIMDAFKTFAEDESPCGDIEEADKVKACKKTKEGCSGKCGSRNLCLSFEDERKWHRVAEIYEIYDILDGLKDDNYMLVAGHIGHDVCSQNKDLKVYIDVSGVKDLRSYALTSNLLAIGANLTISEAIDIFSKVSVQDPSFKYLSKVKDHFEMIGNIAIRNVATIAGNLAIKNFHDFPSDIFVLFEAVDAKLELLTSKTSKITVTMAEFMEQNLSKKIITKILFPAYDPQTYAFGSYKIMPRAQNTPAYVNAAIFLEFKNSKVSKASICYGGVGPGFSRGKNTEKYLVSQDIEDSGVVSQAIKILNQEIQDKASSEFHKNLAISLFYKFILTILPSSKIPEKLKSGAKSLKIEGIASSRHYQSFDDGSPLGNPVPKVEGDILSSGEAKFSNDMPKLTNELYAAFVKATKVHGVIKEIDAGDALKIPGVAAFYSAKDIPGNNTFMPENYLFVDEPEEIFCSSKVLFHSQAVGVILAETFELAHQAAKRVKIRYEDDAEDGAQKLYLTFDDVKSSPNQILPDNENSKILENPPNLPDIKSLTGTFSIGSQYHLYMETQTCVCIPCEKGFEVYSSTQWMDAVQTVISESLNMPKNQINMHVSRIGGGFGGKVSRSSQVGVACALGAYYTGRPVRLIMKMEDNMKICGLRYCNMAEYEVKFSENGKILHLNNEYIEDFGSSLNEPVSLGTTAFLRNCYDYENFNIVAYKARTNKASNTWCRGPGPLEGVAMIENVMEHIAWKLKVDPVGVRIANLPAGSEMRVLLENFVKECDYQNRLDEIQAFNNNNRWIKRGISIVPVKYPTEYFGTLQALVSIFNRDGSVSITVGGLEMGQGLLTKVVQTASHALSIPVSMINVKWANSTVLANATVSGGNITSEMSCEAVRRACGMLMDRLEVVRKEHKVTDWEELVNKAYALEVDLSAYYMFKPSDLTPYDTYAATCTEVELDVLTGNVLVSRVDIAIDCDCVNPAVDIGQMEGGYVMGLGLWLMEKIEHDPVTGELLTSSTWNYITPCVKDIPKDFRVNVRRRPNGSNGRIVSSKAAGESALVTSVSMIFALRQALNSARKDSGLDDEYYALNGPATGDVRFMTGNTRPEMLRF